VGQKASLDVLEKRKIAHPCQKSKPDHPQCSPVTILTVLPQLLHPSESTFILYIDISDIIYFNPLKPTGYFSTTRSNNQNFYIPTTGCFV
jgi:hypothetical protein